MSPACTSGNFVFEICFLEKPNRNRRPISIGAQIARLDAPPKPVLEIVAYKYHATPGRPRATVGRHRGDVEGVHPGRSYTPPRGRADFTAQLDAPGRQRPRAPRSRPRPTVSCGSPSSAHRGAARSCARSCARSGAAYVFVGHDLERGLRRRVEPRDLGSYKQGSW